jgi:hypothetical protein
VHGHYTDARHVPQQHPGHPQRNLSRAAISATERV